MALKASQLEMPPPDCHSLSPNGLRYQNIFITAVDTILQTMTSLFSRQWWSPGGQAGGWVRWFLTRPLSPKGEATWSSRRGQPWDVYRPGASVGSHKCCFGPLLETSLTLFWSPYIVLKPLPPHISSRVFQGIYSPHFKSLSPYLLSQWLLLYFEHTWARSPFNWLHSGCRMGCWHFPQLMASSPTHTTPGTLSPKYSMPSPKFLMPLPVFALAPHSNNYTETSVPYQAGVWFTRCKQHNSNG